MAVHLVHVIDDEDAVRRSVAFMLKTSGLAVRSWSSGAEFLKNLRKLESGCVLLDVRMPEIDGLQLQRMLRERGVTLPIVFMTGHGDVSTAVRALKAGAIDLIEKPFDREQLLAALEIGFGRLDQAATTAAHTDDAEVLLHALTGRERDVLCGLTLGYPNKTIAYDLGISPRTVEVHRAHLMAKFGARSLSDVLRIAFAARLGERRWPPSPVRGEPVRDAVLI